MKIILMTEGTIDAGAIENLIAEIKKTEPDVEIRQLELVRKSIALAIEEVAIFVLKAAGTLLVQHLLKAGISWAKDRIEFEGDNSRDKFIVIFGDDGIPLAAGQVSPRDEVYEVPAENVPRVPALPPHLL